MRRRATGHLPEPADDMTVANADGSAGTVSNVYAPYRRALTVRDGLLTLAGATTALAGAGGSSGVA